jgi:hypothetical protein
MQNPIVHFEIGCCDLETTQTFFGSLFDWKMQRAGNAAMIDTASPVSGLISCLGHEPHHYTIFYAQVEDVGGYRDKKWVPRRGAHRIGQTRPIFTYRRIARDTVEEKVLELQKSKRDLVAAIIGAENSMIRDLRSEDLELLLS